MPHRAQDYVVGSVIPIGLRPNQVNNIVLTHIQAATIREALQADAKGYFFSGSLSISDAIHGLVYGLYTWATVKLYYSIFYLLRSFLCLNGVCLFYVGSNAKIVNAMAGQVPRNPPGGRRGQTTHGAILETFKDEMPQHYLLSQDINNQNPLDWLHERRVDANYGNARFFEPTVPQHFETLESYRIRQLVDAYLDAGNSIYTFDPDHAVLAYPLKAVELLVSHLKALGLYDLTDDDLRYIRQRCCDDAGVLPKFHKLFER